MVVMAKKKKKLPKRQSSQNRKHKMNSKLPKKNLINKKIKKEEFLRVGVFVIHIYENLKKMII